MHFFTAFPDDWLSGTADLSTEESGTFWNLICHYMLKDGQVPDDDRVLARVTKLSIRRWRQVKETLIDGAFIEIREGVIWQAKCEERLKKDGKFATSQREKIKKRWAKKNANALKGKDVANTPVDTPADTSPTPSSVPNGTGALAAPAVVDPASIIFGKSPGGCLHYLLTNGVKENSARGLLGKWRQAHGEGAVIDVVAQAGRNAVSDPVPWIEASLRAKARRSAAPADDGWL